MAQYVSFSRVPRLEIAVVVGMNDLEHPGLSVSPRIVLYEVEAKNPEGTGYIMLMKAEANYDKS